MKSSKETIAKKSIYFIVLVGLLVAIEVVLERMLSFPQTGSVRYGPAFIVRAVSGVVLGPVGAGITGGLSDIIGCLLNGYPPNILLTILAVARSCTYGIFLYKKQTLSRIIASAFVVEIIIGLLLRSLALYTFIKMPLLTILSMRVVQCIIMVPCEIIVLLLLNKYLFPILKKMSRQYMEDKKSLNGGINE